MVTIVIDRNLVNPANLCHKLFTWIEARTGMSKIKLQLCMVLFVSLVLLFDYWTIAMIFSNLIGFVFPAYWNIKLLETSPENTNIPTHTNAIKKWTFYWPIFTGFLMAERYLGYILRLIPLYYMFKTIFLIWCSAPIKNNAVSVLVGKYKP